MTNDYDETLLPIILTVEGWVDYFEVHGGQPSLEELDVAFSCVGRVPAVDLLADLYFGSMLTSDTIRSAAGCWSAAEFPERQLGRELWLKLFNAAGYTVDGRPAERPDEPLRLYRGATAAGRDGMSWTDRLEIATDFATGRFRGRDLGRVWTARVDPARLLCHNGPGNRSESEYVIDPTGLHSELHAT